QQKTPRPMADEGSTRGAPAGAVTSRVACVRESGNACSQPRPARDRSSTQSLTRPKMWNHRIKWWSSSALPRAHAGPVALLVGEHPERRRGLVADQRATGRERRGDALLGHVVRHVHVEVEALLGHL